MRGIIEEFKRTKETKAMLENIKDVVKEEDFYSIKAEEMKEILQKRSFNIEREGKLIKTLIHNIVDTYGEDGINIVKYIECGNLGFNFESDQDIKGIETLIDILEELADIPIIRETCRYLNITKEKRNENEESGIFVNWEKQFKEEEKKNKELEEQLRDIRIKYKAMKMTMMKTAPSEREYSKKEIKATFEIIERRDLKKAQKVLTKDPSLIFIKNEKRNTLLNKASRDGWIEGVDLLLDLGVGVDEFIEIKDKNGWTPLINASFRGHLEVVKYLIEKGANIEAKDKDGNTPLIVASSGGKLEVVQYLIEKGSNIEVKDNNGWTPLIWAGFRGHLEAVKYLIEKGANIEAKDKDGNTPLIVASSNGNLDIVKYLIGKGANIEVKDNNGWTPLIWAGFRGHLEVIQYLVENGANIEVKDNDGNTPLIVASSNGNLDIVKYLIGKGANIEAKDNDGKNPLIWASYKGHLEVIQYLIENGANVDAKNNDGWTPLKISKEHDVKEVEKYLFSIGAKE